MFSYGRPVTHRKWTCKFQQSNLPNIHTLSRTHTYKTIRIAAHAGCKLSVLRASGFCGSVGLIMSCQSQLVLICKPLARRRIGRHRKRYPPHRTVAERYLFSHVGPVVAEIVGRDLAEPCVCARTRTIRCTVSVCVGVRANISHMVKCLQSVVVYIQQHMNT